MSAWRACVRLWVVGSIFWIGFWSWNDISHCQRVSTGILWCPDSYGEVLTRTDYLHAVFFVLGPPLLTLIAGLACAWAVRASQDSLDRKSGGPDLP